jgi:hypothetical protein
MRTLSEQWDNFRLLCIPVDAPAAQLREMQRAFYAGAGAHHDITVALGEDEVTEEEGIATLDALQTELLQFGKKVEAGHA